MYLLSNASIDISTPASSGQETASSRTGNASLNESAAAHFTATADTEIEGYDPYNHTPSLLPEDLE